MSLTYLKLSLANFPRGAAPVHVQEQHRIDLGRISKTVALSLRDRKAEPQVTFCERFGNRLAERDGYVDRLYRS